jgi:ketosteroid isomerase-like protein
MAFTGPLEDRILIRERMSAYADAAFRGDPEAWLENWIEDCTWAGPAFELHGKPALLKRWHKIWSTLAAMTFFTEIGAIEVLGDRALARCYCREILVRKNGDCRKYVGRYDDELVRQDGRWLFAKRTYSVLMDEGPVPLAD